MIGRNVTFVLGLQHSIEKSSTTEFKHVNKLVPLQQEQAFFLSCLTAESDNVQQHIIKQTKIRQLQQQHH